MILFLIFLLCFGLVALNRFKLINSVDHPLLLIIAPFIYCLLVFFLSEFFGYLEPVTHFDLKAFLFLLSSFLCISVAFFFKSSSRRNFQVSASLSSLSIKAFRITALIGLIGTIGLLSGIVSNFSEFLFLLSADIKRLDKDFFNSSYALLWQANIASLFWFSLSYKFTSNKFDILLLFLALVSILMRFAFIYIVIAACYLFIPMVARGMIKFKQFFRFTLLLYICLNILIFAGYSFLPGEVLTTYLQKTYPYTGGNIVNLLIHLENFPIALSKVSDYSQIIEAFGLRSIFLYLDEYFSLDILLNSNMIFFQQVENMHVYGNTHTIFGQMMYLPVIIYYFYLIFFGALLKFSHDMSRRSLAFLTVHTWFCAASVLSFGGAGHFMTTRFFPAVLFIFPLYVILKISESKSSN
jgi:hypothetical protein